VALRRTALQNVILAASSAISRSAKLLQDNYQPGLEIIFDTVKNSRKYPNPDRQAINAPSL
jgi:hypothetical protein